MSNISQFFDKLEEYEKSRLTKIQKMRENPNSIEYWEDHGDGGFWKPLTEEIAGKDWNWNLDDIRINDYYLVKAFDGVRIITTQEYNDKIYGENVIVLCKGNYDTCRAFIKVV